MHYNDVIKEEEVLKYVKLNISKMHYVWIDEFKIIYYFQNNLLI